MLRPRSALRALARRARLAAALAAAFAAAPAARAPAAPAQAPPRVVVLGIAQDGGVPHAGCRRACCAGGRHVAVASLALVDPASRRWWLFDATPDLREQLRRMEREAPGCTLAGVFLTHAHIGHYAGLVHFGREVMGARGIPVWAMPRMRDFLATNGPWDQLVRLSNVALRPLAADSAVSLAPGLRVTPFLVPHRDEYSETVGFRIEGPARTVAFVPDIDKWERWHHPLESLIAACDVAYLDGTFYAAAELPGRDMSEIPHPLVVETLARIGPLPLAERSKVRFIHLNHTNPALASGPERAAIERAGARVAAEGERVALGGRAPAARSSRKAP